MVQQSWGLLGPGELPLVGPTGLAHGNAARAEFQLAVVYPGGLGRQPSVPWAVRQLW